MSSSGSSPSTRPRHVPLDPARSSRTSLQKEARALSWSPPEKSNGGESRKRSSGLVAVSPDKNPPKAEAPARPDNSGDGRPASEDPLQMMRKLRGQFSSLKAQVEEELAQDAARAQYIHTTLLLDDGSRSR